MAAKNIEMLTVQLEPKPGALEKVYAAFREAKVNVIASWAYQLGPESAQAHFYASDTAKAKGVLEKLGKSPKVDHVCYVEGTDEVGRYQELLKKIADAKINIEATDAFAIGGKFATLFFAQEADIGKLCAALGAK